jgi:hypothetical protein
MKVRVIEADGETTTEDLKDHLENWHSWMYEDMHESMAPTVKELAEEHEDEHDPDMPDAPEDHRH